MGDPRLTAGTWVSAYLRRLQGENIACYVARRGDETAGAVLIKCATLDGQAEAFQRSFDPVSGERVWMSLCAGAETDVDATIAGQRRFDPDLWVIEVEDKGGRHLLGTPGLD